MQQRIEQISLKFSKRWVRVNFKKNCKYYYLRVSEINLSISVILVIF